MDSDELRAKLAAGQLRLRRQVHGVIAAREEWLLARHPECGEEDEEGLRDAFAAGWNAARPAIYGTTDGNVSHNKAGRPGELQVTIWGHTEDGRAIALVMGESDAVALRDNLTRMGVGLG